MYLCVESVSFIFKLYNLPENCHCIFFFNLFPIVPQVFKLGDCKQIVLAGKNNEEMKNQLERKCG